MRKLLYVVCVLVLATVGAYAQFPGGGMMPGGMMFGQSNGALLESTSKGVFALRNGVLAKFDTKTLQLAGSVELFGPMPAAPQPGLQQNGSGAIREWHMQVAKRSAPAIMLHKDDSLIIVIGSSFFRVNEDTLVISAQSDLTAPNAAPAAPGRMMMQPATAPAYKLEDDHLLLLEDTELISVNTQDGTVVGRTPLPDAMIPSPMMPRGNRGGQGWGGGGGDGRHGNVNGGNDGAPTPPPAQ